MWPKTALYVHSCFQINSVPSAAPAHTDLMSCNEMYNVVPRLGFGNQMSVYCSLKLSYYVTIFKCYAKSKH